MNTPDRDKARRTVGCGQPQHRRGRGRNHPVMLLRSLGLHGVFIGAHAVAEGSLTRRQLQEGPYVRVLHGVYADPSLPRDHILRCRAAALLMPPEAALGGRSAASLLGAPLPAHGDPVTVLLRQGVKWAGPAGVVGESRRAAVPSSWWTGVARVRPSPGCAWPAPWPACRRRCRSTRWSRAVTGRRGGRRVSRLAAHDPRDMGDVVRRIAEALGRGPTAGRHPAMRALPR